MPNFNNIKNAFEDKKNIDLKKAYFLFKTISYPLISKALTWLLRIAMMLRLPIIPIVKWSIYNHFCGGITIKDSNNTINKLWKYRIGTILDYSAEGKEIEEDFNNVVNQTIESIKVSKNNPKIPFAVFKLTGIAPFNLLEKVNNKSILNDQEKIEYNKLIKRVNQICQEANDNNTPVFFDAEESWIQNTIDDICLQMMIKFNKQKTIIFNTVQLYRHDRIDYINKIILQAEEKKFKIGLKLVRGAYHEKEILRAKSKLLRPAVHMLKIDTDKDYNFALNICLENINSVSICAGTHNEESCMYLIKLMKKFNIKNNDERIHFSQLLGMSDHISYNLSKELFNTSKYVPYGPVREVIPYLIRRAEENTSISGQMGRELSNIVAEIKRRN